MTASFITSNSHSYKQLLLHVLNVPTLFAQLPVLIVNWRREIGQYGWLAIHSMSKSACGVVISSTKVVRANDYIHLISNEAICWERQPHTRCIFFIPRSLNPLGCGRFSWSGLRLLQDKGEWRIYALCNIVTRYNNSDGRYRNHRQSSLKETLFKISNINTISNF